MSVFFTAFGASLPRAMAHGVEALPDRAGFDCQIVTYKQVPKPLGLSTLLTDAIDTYGIEAGITEKVQSLEACKQLVHDVNQSNIGAVQQGYITEAQRPHVGAVFHGNYMINPIR